MLAARAGFRVTSLAVLFRFGQLRNDGNSQELLSGKLNSGLYGFLVSELDITNTSRN